MLQFWNVDVLNFRGNDCTNNEQGIFFFSDGKGGTFCGSSGCPVPDGALSFNNIEGNVDFGVKVDAPALGGPLNAECNWWGSRRGPTHSSNPAGTGDEVIGNVDFKPWRGAEFTGAMTPSKAACRRIP